MTTQNTDQKQDVLLEEDIEVTTKKLHAVTLWKLKVSRAAVQVWQDKNRQDWDLLFYNHKAKTFNLNMPICLTLGSNPHRFVTEYVVDKDKPNPQDDQLRISNMEFVFDISSIVEQHIIGLLLARSKVKPDSSIGCAELLVLQGVVNPITQEYFSQEDLSLFSKMYGDTQETTPHITKLTTIIQGASTILNAPIIRDLVPIELAFGAKISSSVAFWAKESYLASSKTKDSIRLDDLSKAIQDCIVLLDNDSSASKTLKKTIAEMDSNEVIMAICKRLDLEAMGVQFLRTNAFKNEIRLALSALFKIFQQVWPLVGFVLDINDFWPNFVSILNDVIFGVVEPSNKLVSLFFQITKFKPVSGVTSERKRPFEPNVHLKVEAIEQIKSQIWKNLDSIHNLPKDINESVKLIRELFKKQFTHYIDINYSKLKLQWSSDIYFNMCLIFDIDVVKIIRSQNRKSWLEKKTNGYYILHQN
jgi:hypothetical protein